MANVIIPFPLRKYVDNQSEIIAEKDNLAAALEYLWNKYPDLKTELEDSVLMSIFINNEMVGVEAKDWNSVALKADDEVAIIIPIAGG